MALVATEFRAECEEQSRQIEALTKLVEALKDSDALVIAGHTFRSTSIQDPSRTYQKEADFVIVHPAKGIVVVEMKAPKNPRNFFTRTYTVQVTDDLSIETTNAAQAMYELRKTTLTVAGELAEKIRSLSWEMPRRFDPSLVAAGSLKHFSGAVSSYLSVYPGIPEDIEVPESASGTACIGFDDLVAFLARPEHLARPYFYAYELDALAALLDLDAVDARDYLRPAVCERSHDDRSAGAGSHCQPRAIAFL